MQQRFQAAGFNPWVWARRSLTMPDYYTSQQLAQMLGIAEATITALQTKGLLPPTVKDGRSFFSSRQAHCLGLLQIYFVFACPPKRGTYSRGWKNPGWRTRARRRIRLWQQGVGIRVACKAGAFGSFPALVACETSRTSPQRSSRLLADYFWCWLPS